MTDRKPTDTVRAEPVSAPDAPPVDETQPAAGGSGAVPGERGIPSVNRTRSMQSRVTSLLAVGLMILLAGGLLVWYYSGAFTQSARARALAQAAQKRRAQGDAALPSLGVIHPPATGDSVVERILGPAPAPVNAPEIPLAPSNPYARPTGPPPKTPEELELDRQLAGPVLAAASNDRSASRSTVMPTEEGLGAGAAENAVSVQPMGGMSDSNEASGEPNLAALLKPTATPAVRARMLSTQRFMLPKGAFIDCTLETAISSALPGMTTCVTATDTFGADGHIVLLERGSKLVGETRGQLQQGAARLFVLWTEARTPTGVVVPLASPGTDELGRSGLTGAIDRHWWQRFGSAILITVIDGVVQGATRSRGGNDTLILNPSQTNDVVTEVLKNTLQIPPTIEKPQGDRIQILVARDVDFRSVYALRANPGDSDGN